MKGLADFIYRQIAKQAALSADNGRAKYRAYFVQTQLYAACRGEVDAALAAAGHSEAVIPH